MSLQNDEQPGSVGQARNIVRLRNADRLLGVQVPLNADRPGNFLHRPSRSRRSRKRCRAGRHHRKTPSQLMKRSSGYYTAASQPLFVGPNPRWPWLLMVPKNALGARLGRKNGRRLSPIYCECSHRLVKAATPPKSWKLDDNVIGCLRNRIEVVWKIKVNRLHALGFSVL